jgi:epoxyqueuosine reductase
MKDEKLILANEIKALAQEIGYADCGITTAAPFPRFADSVKELQKQFPEIKDLYDNMEKKADPRATTPWANSIIVCVRRFGKYEIPEGISENIGRNYLFDQRYPDCPEHSIPKKMTAGLKELGLRVRRGGVPDREAAARAGVTRFGKNCSAYSDKCGSWMNIATWRVDAELPTDEPISEPICPEGCTACIDACPTGALTKPFQMRMDRCIAYLSYEAPEPIPPELWKKMGKWIYGCDVCQNVCPLNKDKWEELEHADWLDPIVPHLSPSALATMDQDTYAKTIHPAFWYIPVEDLERWHMNAKRALEYEKGE